jgi:hypothetical protein
MGSRPSRAPTRLLLPLMIPGPHQRRIRLAGELKTHLLDSQPLPTPNAQTLHQQHRIAICHGPKAWRRSAALRRIIDR